MKKLILWLIICMGLLAGCKNDAPTANAPPRTSESAPAAIASIPAITEATESTTPTEVDINPPSGGIIEIKEKMFIAQTNDIYYNAEDYLGKTIKYEGIYNAYYWDDEDSTFYSVIRYGPGCCGDDGEAGFEVVWDGEHPEVNDWVEAVGVLEQYEDGGYKYLRLALTSLTVLPTRGAEFVNQ